MCFFKLIIIFVLHINIIGFCLKSDMVCLVGLFVDKYGMWFLAMRMCRNAGVFNSWGQ